MQIIKKALIFLNSQLTIFKTTTISPSKVSSKPVDLVLSTQWSNSVDSSHSPIAMKWMGILGLIMMRMLWLSHWVLHRR